MNETKKLFLLDSYALIFRAYYAFIKNPMRNLKGMNTSTIFGFTLTLDELLRKENPSHIIAVFDASGPTFRHEMYPEYKANRDATPEDIKEAVPWVKKLLEGYKIPVLEQIGYEADDIIGTVAKKAEKEGFDVYMVTPDKDFAQLVSEHIFMYKPGRAGNPAEILGVPEIKEKFRIEEPGQVIDILALMGDSSDNIPGAPGIGEKTAQSLIESFSSVEGVIKNLDKLKGKQKEKLEGAIDQVRLSRTLATIIVDAPVPFDLNLAMISPPDVQTLSTIFDELNFKNLKTRIIGEITNLSNQKSAVQTSLFEQNIEQIDGHSEKLKRLDTTPHDYISVLTDHEFNALITELEKLPTFCFDTETTGLDIIDSKLVAMSFSWEAHKAFYLPWNENERIQSIRAERLKEIFERTDLLLVGQNLKYDLHILKNYGIGSRSRLFDTMVAHYLIYPEHKHGIDAIAESLLGYEKIKTEELIGKRGANQLNFSDLSHEKIRDYACEDADITWQAYEKLKEEVKHQGFSELAEHIEMPLVRVLMEMEHQGVALNTKELEIFAIELRSELEEIETTIYGLAGETFNISSPKQLGDILFDKLKIDGGARKTKSQQYSTGEEILLNLVEKHPIIQAVLDYRSSRKLLSTYVEALPRLIHPTTGRIHTSFNQTLVATGRLSSTNPNLQNIPIREERGREIRRAFTCSRENNYFLSADYSQIELRLMAHLSRDENMIEAFRNHEDIHTSTAAKIYGIPADSVTREMRSKAKTANFGIIYGISAFGLSQRMKIPRAEAKELIDGYFATYPGVKTYMDECIRSAREKGFTETMFGRRRQLPDILSRNSIIRGNAERNAINAPIQGSAADIIKIAMVEIQREIQNNNMGTRMIIQVHDELNFDVPPEELPAAKTLVKGAMERAAFLLVPLIVDINYGKNWLEAH